MDFLGQGLFMFGFVFFLLVFIDKSLDGKLNDVVSHFFFRGKAHEDVEREEQTKQIEKILERIILENTARIIRHINEIKRDSKKDE